MIKVDEVIFSSIQLVMGAALTIAGSVVLLNFTGITVPILALAVAVLYLKDGLIILLGAYVTTANKEDEIQHEGTENIH